MDGLTLANLRHYADQQGAAEQRITDNENAITDMVQRVVGPPIARLQENEQAIEVMRAQLVGPAYERVKKNDQRMNKIRVKLAGPASQRTMENQTVLTGQLARLGTGGFRRGGGTVPVPGLDPTIAQVGQGGKSQVIGPTDSPIGTAPVQPSGPAPVGSALPGGQSLAGYTYSGVPYIGESTGYQPPFEPIILPPVTVPSILAETYQPTPEPIPILQESPFKVPPAVAPEPVSREFYAEPPEGCDICEIIRWAVRSLCACLRPIAAAATPPLTPGGLRPGGLPIEEAIEPPAWKDAPEQARINAEAQEMLAYFASVFSFISAPTGSQATTPQPSELGSSAAGSGGTVSLSPLPQQ